jgi:hypothetical protein
MDYRDILAYREKAICLYDLKNYSEALDVLTKSVAVNNTLMKAIIGWGGAMKNWINAKKRLQATAGVENR